MVIAKHNAIGNCLLWNLNGKLGSKWIIHPWYVNLTTIFFPIMIVGPIIFGCSSFTSKLVPLQSPLDWSMFLRGITGTPIFNLNRWFGIPEHFIQNSNVNQSSCTAQFSSKRTIESTLKYSFSVPRINDRTKSLTISTKSWVGESNALSS